MINIRKLTWKVLSEPSRFSRHAIDTFLTSHFTKITCWLHKDFNIFSQWLPMKKGSASIILLAHSACLILALAGLPSLTSKTRHEMTHCSSTQVSVILVMLSRHQGASYFCSATVSTKLLLLSHLRHKICEIVVI
jgi:hypothetical protein